MSRPSGKKLMIIAISLNFSPFFLLLSMNQGGKREAAVIFPLRKSNFLIEIWIMPIALLGRAAEVGKRKFKLPS